MIKALLPRGLFGRAALILVVPVVTLQLTVSAAFLQRHFEDVTEQMTDAVATELAFALGRISDGGIEAARAVVAPLGIELTQSDGEGETRRNLLDLTGRSVIARLEEELPQLAFVDLATSRRRVTVGLDSAAGPVLAEFPRRRVSASNPHQLLVWTGVTGLLMTAIAYIFLRNQLRPIARLAEAAQAFGAGRIEPYHPSGATEVRAAGTAFLDMRERIVRQVEQRTLMLSGISHDLRTPLTRMRLGLGMLDAEPEEVAALTRDIDEMQALLDAFLDFAQAGAGDDPEPTDPAALLESVVADARRGGGDVAMARCAGVPAVVHLRPVAVRRALSNLIQNALRYGGRAEAALTSGPGWLAFAVEDDGPGIPAADRERAQKPFVRLDAARNQNRGSGVGLGLAIARDVARSHGGTLTLGDAAMGGLRVELRIAT